MSDAQYSIITHSALQRERVRDLRNWMVLLINDKLKEMKDGGTATVQIDFLELLQKESLESDVNQLILELIDELDKAGWNVGANDKTDYRHGGAGYGKLTIDWS